MIDPLVPVIVTVEVPTAVVAAVATVKVDVVVAEAGENVPVAPVGKPEMVNATEPVNPPDGAIATG